VNGLITSLMVRTVVNAVILLLMGLFLFYYLSHKETDYKQKEQRLENKIDSIDNRIEKTKHKLLSYKDSVRVLDSLYKSKRETRDSIRTVYVEKRIPAIDSFTVDSLINYFRSRYEQETDSPS